jgi:DNA-directed RNA polymerase specialized sigma24 family protein
MPPFQRFLDEHANDVYRFLVAVAGRQEADDAFQETFAAALRAYPRLRPDTNLRAWVLTIARRKAIDAHRARGRRAVPVAEPEGAALDGGALTSPPPGEPPDDALWARVAELPPKQRTTVALRFVADLSHEEIAEVLDSTPEAARRNLHVALRTLRKEVTPA